MTKLKYYWDACTWIAFIIKEEDVNGENRYDMCRRILERAKQGNIEIVTSAFTLAEVYKKGSSVENLPKFFEKTYIQIVQVDKEIGLQAQYLQAYIEENMGGKIIDPPDAIHIASAQRANVGVLHSYDEDILKLDGKLYLENGEKMKICEPYQEKDLFDSLK